MIKYVICEKLVCETTKSYVINVLGYTKTSSYTQMTSSKSSKIGLL